MGFFRFLKHMLKDDVPTFKVIEVPSNVERTPPAQPKLDEYIPVTKEDMLPFKMLPFAFDTEIVFHPGSKSPWSMDLSATNRLVADDQVEMLNEYLRQAPLLCDSIPLGLEIPIAAIRYDSIQNYGYSKLFCNPFTKTGKRSKYPVCLFVTTDLSDAINHINCKIYYLCDGSMGKAKAVFWNNHICYSFAFGLVGKTFALTKIETNYGLLPGAPLQQIYSLDI